MLFQVYDQNEAGGFPMLRCLLASAASLRASGHMPIEWLDTRERCRSWYDATHPRAWSLLEDFEGQFELEDDVDTEGQSEGDSEDSPSRDWECVSRASLPRLETGMEKVSCHYAHNELSIM